MLHTIPLQIILDLVLHLFLRFFNLIYLLIYLFVLRGKEFFHFSFFNDWQSPYLVPQVPGLGGVTPAASDCTAGLILNKNKALKGLTTIL